MNLNERSTMPKHHSKVYVEHRDGSKAEGKEVVLGFSSGMTQPAFTDRYGVAIVGHDSTGRATVFVSGSRVGEFTAPGEKVVIV
ncbi:MAG: hypothetical protein IT215_02435 [Chitinophagaceae bacterium]|nr:hypothetical protein [Chitinophagaceae bacterium]